MFHTVLVANRGEIACRILRSLDALGARGVAVYSDADAGAPHVVAADRAVRLGPAPAASSYLDGERVIAAAQAVGAQALHPGYGFLSENAAFARQCADAGIVFIGPPPDAIRTMGDKIAAKRTVEAAGVPVVPGVHEPGMDDSALSAAADEVGYPLLVKAAAGGGGRGMRVVRHPDGLAEALVSARREAAAAFGDDALLLERYLEQPRHIEVQVLADEHGAVVHMGERECSLQRRHQKIIEECPSPLLDDDLRQRMGAAAVAAAKSCGYVGAGTVEFIVPSDGQSFHFLEMNTRLQVEHPVTEMVYGVDLVEWQVRVAAGEPLAFGQEDLVPRGHAIEARVYAEDPVRGFLPTGGTVVDLEMPSGPGIRVDSGVAVGTEVTSHYDPMLAKVIAHAPDRPTALRRLDGALARTHILGFAANTAFLRALLADADVAAGRLDTGLVERRVDALVDDAVPDDVLAAAGLALALALEPQPGTPLDVFTLPGGWRIGEPAWTRWSIRAGEREEEVRVRGRAAACHVAVGQAEPLAASVRSHGGRLIVTLDGHTRAYMCAQHADVGWIGRDGSVWTLAERGELSARAEQAAGAAGPMLSPMPGIVAAVYAAVGDEVAAGATVAVVEAMKMEHAVAAPVDGRLTALHVEAGQQVAMDEVIGVVEEVAP